METERADKGRPECLQEVCCWGKVLTRGPLKLGAEPALRRFPQLKQRPWDLITHTTALTSTFTAGWRQVAQGKGYYYSKLTEKAKNQGFYQASFPGAGRRNSSALKWELDGALQHPILSTLWLHQNAAAGTGVLLICHSSVSFSSIHPIFSGLESEFIEGMMGLPFVYLLSL